MLLKHELLFLIAGGVFVIEFLSVFIQDYIGIKLLKRRIFYRAPIHHTYQFLGIAEPKIVVRFWILAGDLHPGQPDQHQAALTRRVRRQSRTAPLFLQVLRPSRHKIIGILL